MAPPPGDLGERIAVYGANRGIGGFENRGFWASRWIWVPLATFFFLIFGLLIGALFFQEAESGEDTIALIVSGVVGAGVGYFLAPRIATLVSVGGAAVTEAQVFTHGMILTDSRGRHEVRWNVVSEVAGRRTQHRLEGVQVRVSHQFVVRTADKGFWLDERLENVSELASRIAHSAGVPITPLAA